MMRKLLIIILLSLITIGCGNASKTTNKDYTFTLGTSQYNVINTTMSSRQVDSLAIADSLSPDMNKWRKNVYRSQATGRPITQWLYIRDYGKTYVYYIVTSTECDTMFVVAKRIDEK